MRGDSVSKQAKNKNGGRPIIGTLLKFALTVTVSISVGFSCTKIIESKIHNDYNVAGVPWFQPYYKPYYKPIPDSIVNAKPETVRVEKILWAPPETVRVSTPTFGAASEQPRDTVFVEKTKIDTVTITIPGPRDTVWTEPAFDSLPEYYWHVDPRRPRN